MKEHHVWMVIENNAHHEVLHHEIDYFENRDRTVPPINGKIDVKAKVTCDETKEMLFVGYYSG